MTAGDATETITEYRIVGFTVAVTDGLPTATDGAGGTVKGIDAMNRMCELEFGTSARAAFSAEQLTPSLAPSTAPIGAWVRPTNPRSIFVPDAPSGSDDWQRYDEATGVESRTHASMSAVNNELDCAQWGFNGTTVNGLFRSTDGAYGDFPCDTLFPVACSAPTRIAVTP